MKPAAACLAAAMLLVGCISPPSEEEADGVPPAAEAVQVVEPSLMTLPDGLSFRGKFHSDPYIRAAVRLQGMGRVAATKTLQELAREESASVGHRAIILCRMLFTKKTGGEFRRPALGETVFLGGSGNSNWPLEPISMIDGVPFQVVRGYLLAGKPESSENYLAYCLAECDWSGFRFVPKTTSEKEKALDKLIRSPKWKKPLGEHQLAFLSKQVE